ncbi:hypothetical protein ABE504_25105 [Paenibacillus oryzisoli]|uniref:hypothetical protein n=1 Tax=Paenibacillus oryzisoli TaxID=1850517 RepID=UPI003D2985CD
MSPYYTANEVKDILGVSTSQAYERVRQLNIELQSNGLWTEPGRVPKAYFHERLQEKFIKIEVRSVSIVFYNARDIQYMLGLNSVKTAYLRIVKLNKELEKMGYWTEPGRVPKKIFHEKYPYIEPMDQEEKH